MIDDRYSLWPAFLEPWKIVWYKKPVNFLPGWFLIIVVAQCNSDQEIYSFKIFTFPNRSQESVNSYSYYKLFDPAKFVPPYLHIFLSFPQAVYSWGQNKIYFFRYLVLFLYTKKKRII